MGSQFTRLCVAALVVCACSSALGGTCPGTCFHVGMTRVLDSLVSWAALRYRSGHGPWTVQAPRVIVIVWVLVYALRWLRDSSNARAVRPALAVAPPQLRPVT